MRAGFRLGAGRMKAKEIFENAVALNISKYNFDTPYKEHCAIDLINGLIAHTFRHNNIKRVAKGKAEMLEIPFIKSLGDEFDFEEEFYAPLSYGLASLIARDFEDIQLSIVYENQCITLLSMV